MGNPAVDVVQIERKVEQQKHEALQEEYGCGGSDLVASCASWAN